MVTKFGGCVVYVEDVLGTVSFYEKAFGLERKFVSEKNLYAEMKGLAAFGLQSAISRRATSRPSSCGATAARSRLLLKS